MKLTTNTRFEPERVVTADEAVTYVAHRSAGQREGELERANARYDALESMLGQLIAAMIDNGALRANQVEAIFNYDVSAED